MKLEKLQEQLGYYFSDRGVLFQALTHRSYGHEHFQEKPIALRDNERLEFLGDAVLDLILSDILLESFPNAKEGYLSKMRAALVNEKTLAQIARSIPLSENLLLGKGEEQTGGRYKDSILSCALEAIIAAIYLDGGFQAVYPVVRFLFAPFFEEEKDLISYYDYKTQLQELAQAQWRTVPIYQLRNSHGPDHAKIFEVEVSLQGELLGKAEGSSKKEAEQNAARAAIQALSV